MARYIVERNVPPEFDLEAARRRARQVHGEMPNIKWIRSWLSEASGKIYCEYDAPNPEAIREHARRAELPADTITLVEMEVNPTMFR